MNFCVQKEDIKEVIRLCTSRREENESMLFYFNKVCIKMARLTSHIQIKNNLNIQTLIEHAILNISKWTLAKFM